MIQVRWMEEGRGRQCAYWMKSKREDSRSRIRLWPIRASMPRKRLLAMVWRKSRANALFFRRSAACVHTGIRRVSPCRRIGVLHLQPVQGATAVCRVLSGRRHGGGATSVAVSADPGAGSLRGYDAERSHTVYLRYGMDCRRSAQRRRVASNHVCGEGVMGMPGKITPIVNDFLVRFQQGAVKETGRRPLTFLRTPMDEGLIVPGCQRPGFVFWQPIAWPDPDVPLGEHAGQVP